MKLVFHGLDDISRHIKGTPTFRTESGGVIRAVSFILDEPLVLEEGQELVGNLEMLSDDDMYLNDFNVEDFLRYEMSGDESTYLTLTQDPIPEPPEPAPEPTEEEKLASAKNGREQSIISARDAAIYAGVDVETEYGLEHFTLNERDQTLLLGIYGMIQQGMTAYPYHSVSADATSSNICTVYSDEDIAKIATAAFSHITYQESYANMLLQWLDRETDVDTVYTIEWGATLPEDLLSYMAMIMTSAGVDPSIIPGYLEIQETVDGGEEGETEPSTDETGEVTEETENSEGEESEDQGATEEPQAEEKDNESEEA
jgi:hypothetical protein